MLEVLSFFLFYLDQIYVGIGRSTNNYAKMIILKLVMLLALSRCVQKIHVWGDSKLVIDWMNLKRSPKNVFLNPLYEEFARIASIF